MSYFYILLLASSIFVEMKLGIEYLWYFNIGDIMSEINTLFSDMIDDVTYMQKIIVLKKLKSG